MQRNVAGDCGIPFSVIPYSWKKMEQVPQKNEAEKGMRTDGVVCEYLCGMACGLS